MRGFATRIAAAVAAMSGAALAGEEAACTAQYSLEDQVILEWAALGGDPHAQMALAQCAFPEGGKKMSSAERIYAIKWTTLAACEAQATPAHDRRDIRTRKLKEDASLSFRRFGGLSKSEKLNWREKDFLEFRKEQFARLEQRRATLAASVSDEEMAAARDEIAGQFSRFGAIGLLRLAELSSCRELGASLAFEAAAWSAANDAWKQAARSGVYAKADGPDYNFAKTAAQKLAALDAPARAVAARERDALMRTDPARIAGLETKLAELEDRQALASLANFALPAQLAYIAPIETGEKLSTNLKLMAPKPALTTALQFALEALGHVNFVNGPDNDYGPTTKGAVARLHAVEEPAAEPALSAAESRDLVCAAAVGKNDPVSLYHVALMYQNGWGFPRDEAKAAAALSRAETAMIAALGGEGDLSDWKREAYLRYARDIRRLKGAKDAPPAPANDSICQ